MREVPAEDPTLALAPGREFFVASSAVGVSHLSRLSSSIPSFRNLWNPAMLLVRLLIIWWPAAWLGQLPVIWWSCRRELVQPPGICEAYQNAAWHLSGNHLVPSPGLRCTDAFVADPAFFQLLTASESICSRLLAPLQFVPSPIEATPAVTPRILHSRR